MPVTRPPRRRRFRVSMLGIFLAFFLLSLAAMQAHSWWQSRQHRERQRQLLGLALEGMEEGARVVLAEHPDWNVAAERAFDGGETIVVVTGWTPAGTRTAVELQRVRGDYVIVAERELTRASAREILSCPDISLGPPPGVAAHRPRVADAVALVARKMPGARITVVAVEDDGGLVVALAEKPGDPAWLVQVAYEGGRYVEARRETMTDEYLRSRVKRAPEMP